MILVIGRTGQLARALTALRPDAVAIGREALDVTDTGAIARIIAEHAPSVVVNATAHTAVDRAESEAELAGRINADAPAAMATACRAAGARFVHVSTDFVFDGQASSPYPTDTPTAPLSVYGATKADGEARVLAADPNALIVRTAWVYDADGRNFATTMLRLMAERDEVRVIADQVGTPTSSATLARALLELAECGAGGVHHFTDAGIASWYDFAVAIADVGLATGRLTRAPRVTPITTADYPTPARRPSYGVLDKSATWPLLATPPRHWQHVLTDVLSHAETQAAA